MGIMDSLYTAENGLTAHGDAMNVVSDNIANTNTDGYKSQRANFQDVLANANVYTNQVNQGGQGSRMTGASATFTQGALRGTGVATDVAIQGDGFFVVSGSYQGVNQQYYTRAGQFHLDNNGHLVNPQGLVAQGYSADATGTLSTVVGDLQLLTNATMPPQGTANVRVSANLDAEAATPATAFDPTNPSAGSNFSTSVAMYDSLGDAHNVDVYFRKTGTGAWDWYAVADGGDLTGGTAGTGTQVGTGSLTFGTDGTLTSTTGSPMSVNFLNATANQSVALNFGDATGSGGTGLEGITSFAGPSSVSGINQDGYGAGALATINISSDGTITGGFTNGVNRTVGQFALAEFRNDEGLSRLGGTLFQATSDSGDPAIGIAGTGGRGSVNAGALEQSNVNLSQEFINLMAYQRGFQANTRTVHTSDEMLQELVNLKR